MIAAVFALTIAAAPPPTEKVPPPPRPVVRVVPPGADQAAAERRRLIERRKLVRLKAHAKGARSRAEYDTVQAAIAAAEARQAALEAAIAAEQRRRWIDANTPRSRIITSDGAGRTSISEIYSR